LKESLGVEETFDEIKLNDDWLMLNATYIPHCATGSILIGSFCGMCIAFV